MNCMHCGTLLPRGALFCGECGRRVAPAGETGPVRRQAAAPRIPAAPAPELQGPPTTPRGSAVDRPEDFDLSGPPVRAARPETPPARAKRRPGAASTPAPGPAPGAAAAATTPAQPAHDESRCEQCGNLLAPGDIFCGECGFVSRAVTQKFSRVSGTARPPASAVASPTVAAAAAQAAAATSIGMPSAIIPSLPTRPIDIDPELLLTGEPAPWPAASKRRPGAGAASKPVDHAPPASQQADAAAAASAAEPHRHVAPPLDPHPHGASRPEQTAAQSVAPRAGAAASADDDDIEATRIVARSGGARFVLQFSTGESVTVNGSGLLGRNPRPEPGEFFDQLVRVLDAGRSVSKTHLEFGQEGGVFWVRDRFSGNGTVVREPGAPPRRCDADKRYSVTRGSRVDIGEQFFVVS